MSSNSRRSRRCSVSLQRTRKSSWFRRYLRGLRTGLAAASIGAVGLLSQPAYGANHIWIGNTSNLWSVPANWSAIPVAGEANQTLQFGAAGSAGTLLIDNFLAPAQFTLDSVTFAAGAPSYTITPSAGFRGFTVVTGSIVNNSTNLQNFNENITINGVATVNTAAGNIALGGVLSGPGTLDLTGTGAVTLSGNNSLTGGITVNAGTTLNLTRATAPGIGAITFAGASTLNNTSTAPFTLANNNVINVNDNLTFTGTQNLNLGTGAVTLGGTGQKTITVNNGATLTTGVMRSFAGSGTGLTVAGNGTLFLAPIAGNGATQLPTVEGALNVVTGARINTGINDTFFGSLTGGGTVANGSVTTRWTTVGTDNTDSTFSGTLIDGGTGLLGLRKRGTGTLTLTGQNTLSHQLTFENGTVVIPAGASLLPATPYTGTAANANLIIGNTDNQKAILRLQGDLRVTTIALGQGSSPTNRSGALYQTGGTLNVLNGASVNNFRIGDGAGGGAAGTGGYGYYSLSGGTLNLAEFAVGGGNNGQVGNIGVMDMSGGTVNDLGWVTMARGNTSTGILNLTGGTLNYALSAGGLFSIGLGGGTGWYSVTNVSNAVLQNALNSNVQLNLAQGGTTGTGIVNAGPGALIRAGNLAANAGHNSYFNFLGGTLQAAVSNANFISTGGGQNIAGFVVYPAGGTIDNNGRNIGILRSQGLSAPTGDGITTIAVADGGSGYIGAPAVVVTGVPGASASANMISDGAGGLKVGSITVTSPGVDASAPAVELRGGGFTTAATLGAITTAPNSSGGMTFTGSGNTTLAGASTYTGATNITGGTLLLTGTLASNAVNINGAGARLRANATIAAPTVVNVTNGILDGIGTVETATVGAGTGGVLTNGNGTATPLTVNNLIFSGAGTWSPVLSDATAATPALNSTTITTTGAGSVTVSPTNIAGSFTNTTYTLAGYTTLAGTGFPAFTANVAGLGVRQTQTLTNDTVAKQIKLTIGGDFAIWTGATNGNWNTATQNWKLSSSNAATNYVSGDAVVFDDSAPGTKTVAISGADVTPARVTFNNSTGTDYVINGPNVIAGTGALFVNNTGAATLNTANTFTGGVTVSNPTATSVGALSGVLKIGHNTAVGTGRLTLGLNSTIDAVGGPRTLTNNNAQSWDGDFTVIGTNDLNLGTGPVTITRNANNTPGLGTTGTAGSSSRVNVLAGTLTVGGPIAGPGVALVKDGPGRLVLNGLVSHSQQTVIHNGELVTSGGLGTINQNIQISPIAGDNGTFTVTGGTINVSQVKVSGSGNDTPTNGSWSPATMNMTGGTVNVLQWFTVGAGGRSGGGNTGTAVPGATGTFNMSGGTLTINTGVSSASFEIGNFENMIGVVNQTGGDIRVINSGGGGGNGNNGPGILMLSNPSAAGATYNMSGGTLTTYLNDGLTIGGGSLRVGNNATGAATATFNLNGGVVQVERVEKPGAGQTGIFNFNGGVLKAARATGTFMQGLSQANISQASANPAIIDDNGVVVTIAQNLLHGAFAATDGGLTKQGTGTLALSGNNTYNGGTRVNVGTLGINSASAIGTGPLTIGAAGVTIDNTSANPVILSTNNAQNWNNDFIFGGTRSLDLGTGAVAMSATRTVTANVVNAGAALTVGGAISGTGFGLNKNGLGTLALGGANTYTGATSVLGGTLSLTGAGAINSSSGVTVNGGRLVQSSTTPLSPTVALTAGTVDGTSTINTLNVANTPIAIVAHGNGAVDPITIGSLTFAGASTVNITTSDASQAIPKIATTSLATNAAGNVVITATNTGGLWNPGTFALMSYTGAIGGAGFNQIVSGQFVGLSARQTVDLTNVAGVISAVIAGDTLVWTGALNGTWSTAVQAAPKNWKLSTSGAGADFITNDAINFPNGATTGTVEIAANVNPAGVQFTNTAAGLPYTLQSAGGFGISSGSVSVVGGGMVTITNTNTHLGGTNLVNGTLNINNGGTANPAASAIGLGPLTITGGTLDNTSGAAQAVATNNAQNWNGNFTFAGSSVLDLGNGAVTLGGGAAGDTRTVTVANNQLIVGPISGDRGLTKAGPGFLTINSQSGGNGAQSNFTGTLTVAEGTLQIGTGATASDFNAGGLAGSGTVENGSAQTRWVFLNQPGNTTFSGVLQDGFGGGRLGLVKNGAGNLTLTGANTLSDRVSVNGGKLILSGGGSINAAVAGVGAPSIQVGGGNATQQGYLRVEPGSTITVPTEVWLTNGEGAYGAMDMTGGTVTMANWFAVSRTGGIGVLNMSGGEINVSAQQMTIGSLGTIAGAGVPRGVANISGGTLNVTNNIFASEQNNGVLNVSGTAVVNAGLAVRLAVTGAGVNGIVNLLGGQINTPTVNQGQGTGVFNFNGGTLRPSAFGILMTATGNTGTLNAYSHAGGAKIDTNGNDTSIDIPIQAPPGNGVSATGLTVSGGGYIGTPAVSITGGGGVGATANATIDANGNLTGIVITNPGRNYTSAPTFALLGGGVGNTGALGGAATLAPNVSGGLTKQGLGNLTLSAVNTYTGATRVELGTLTLGIANAINTESKLELAGGTFATGGLSTDLGQLHVLANSVLDMGFGASVLNFDNSNALAWTGNLTIDNWELVSGDQIFIGTAAGGLTNTQLNRIKFTGSPQPAAILLATGELRPGTPGAGMLLGDVTRDNHVNVQDITAMMTALSNMPVYRAANPTLTDGNIIEIFDLSGSGTANNADVQSLITYLKNGNGSTAPVPEPGTLVLMVLAAIPGVFMARKLRYEK